MAKSKPKKRKEIKLKINLWRVVIALLIFMFMAPLVVSFLQLQVDGTQVEISQVMADIREGKIKEVVVQDEKLLLTYSEDDLKVSTKEKDISFTELLESYGLNPADVNYGISDQSVAKVFSEIGSVVLPIVLMAGFFFFVVRAQNKGAADIFSFGKSKAKVFAKGKQDVTFADVAGVDDAKKELEEIVDFLKNPAKYRKIGARTPKGVILFGPSGVGKTLLSKALAGEARVPFFSMAGSEFMEMLVGIGD